MLTITIFQIFANIKTWKEMVDPNINQPPKVILKYLKTHKGWPDFEKIVEKGEKTLTKHMSDEFLLDWFAQYKPETTYACCLYIELLRKNCRMDEAERLIFKTWQSKEFTKHQQEIFFKQYGHLLTNTHHKKRIAYLLYNKKYDQAKELLENLPRALKEELSLHIQIIDNPDKKINIQKINSDNFIFDLICYHLKNNNHDILFQLLSRSYQDEKDYDQLWWNVRAILARRFIEQKQYKKALIIVQKAKVKCLEVYSEKLWLEGWIHFSFFKNKNQAYKIFAKLYEVTNTPISRSRGAYWASLCSPTKKSQNNWLKRASNYYYTYYGTLAQEQLKQKFNFKTYSDVKTIKITPLINDTFSINNSNFDTFEKFIKASFIQIKSFDEGIAFFKYGLNKCDKINRAFFSIITTKAITAKFYKHPLLKESFPEFENEIYTNYIRKNFKKDPRIKSLILAITRQESQFNPKVISYLDAIGYMQLILPTAKMEAKKFNLRIQSQKDVLNPKNNINLGTSHILSLIEYYGGSFILAIAAYHAGSSNVNKWIELFGDPRLGQIPIIQWIEIIPLKQTRNYIMRVTENMYIYLQKEVKNKITLYALLNAGSFGNEHGKVQPPVHLQNLSQDKI